MKRSFHDIRGFDVHARDGQLGHVHDLVVATDGWRAAFLAVDTGKWLAGHHALIKPSDVQAVDIRARRIDLSLTKEEVEALPSLESLRVEEGHPSWAHYWITGGPIEPGLEESRFGPIVDEADPLTLAGAAETTPEELAEPVVAGGEPTAPRSARIEALRGCRVDAANGDRVGEVRDAVVDVLDWTIPFLEVSTGGLLSSHRTLLPTTLVRSADAAGRQVMANVAAELFTDAPACKAEELDPAREAELRQHFGAPLPPLESGYDDVESEPRPGSPFHEGHDLRV